MLFSLPNRLRHLAGRFKRVSQQPPPDENPREYLKLTDGEFALNILELLLDRESALPEHIEEWQFSLKEDPKRRVEALLEVLDDYIERKREGEQPHDPNVWWIMGTDRFLERQDWVKRGLELAKSSQLLRKPRAVARPFEHSGEYVVSAIASLYCGGKYIEKFLQNITSQTIFDRSELIIIDANSPEGEAEIISKYQALFPNIIYRRMDFRISVYEAWNLGVELSRGMYLTNVNLDDLRRHDSFELQADALKSRRFADVVYQDFYYSLDDNLDFDDVAQFGFKSDLPHITKNNLMAYNAPHNAPMWRKRLHEELGLFDVNFRSAADWEFWLRCMTNGKHFTKIGAPHVVYFHNPKGISTSSETRGVSEARRICRTYSRKLMSRHLLSSRADFAAAVGPQEDVERLKIGLDGSSRYDAVQMQLLKLAKTTHVSRGGGHVPDKADTLLKVLVDGVFFQLAQSGIARVWASVLPRLAALPGVSVVLLDRGSAPMLQGVTYISFPPFSFRDTATDSALIERCCKDEAADVFVSTYYTTPLSTPSVLMIYDMIPEVLGFDLENRAWKEKQLSIAYASNYICISNSSRADLMQFNDYLLPDRVVMAYCGLDREIFCPRDRREIDDFRLRFGLAESFYLLVGAREQHAGYKNAVLFFQALRGWPDAAFDIVCVGGESAIPAEWLHGLPPSVTVHKIDLSDNDLACAYSGSKALVFPSKYEGFGLPVVEAFACGCPVVTTRFGSLAEVGDDAATFISGHDPGELRQALKRLEYTSYRSEKVERGLTLAMKYRWDTLVDTLYSLLRLTVDQRRLPASERFFEEWERLRKIQAEVDWHLL